MKLNHRVHAVLDAITRFLRDNQGAAAAVVAAVLPVLIGFETLGVETGLWYLIKWQSQSAADAAAIAAAYELIAGKTDVAGALAAAASEAAAHNGYTGTAPRIVYPYSDGIVANGVAVYLRRTERLFGSIFMPTVDATGCAVAANSTSLDAIEVRSSTGSLRASTPVTPGEISLGGTPIDPTTPPSEFTPTPRVLIGATSIADPYANTLTHAFLSSQMRLAPAASNFSAMGVTTFRPGRHTEGMLVDRNARVDLIPGVYYVTEGDFSIESGATVTCTTCNDVKGVTIVLTSADANVGGVGNVRIASGASVTLRAPNTGTFAGLLFIQDSLAVPAGGNTPDSVLAGGSGMNLTGLLYFPKTKVQFQGHPDATCTLLIAGRVGINGSAGFAASGCAGAGLTGRPAIYTAA